MQKRSGGPAVGLLSGILENCKIWGEQAWGGTTAHAAAGVQGPAHTPTILLSPKWREGGGPGSSSLLGAAGSSSSWGHLVIPSLPQWLGAVPEGLGLCPGACDLPPAAALG